jgi:hypothetical protein
MGVGMVIIGAVLTETRGVDGVRRFSPFFSFLGTPCWQ